MKDMGVLCPKVVKRGFLKQQKGYTVVEMLAVFACIGFMTGMFLLTFEGGRDATNEKMAVGRACLINGAKALYVREEAQTAITNWANAGSDSERFILVRGYLGPSAQGIDFNSFMPTGYTMALGAIGERVKVYHNLSEIKYD